MKPRRGILSRMDAAATYAWGDRLGPPNREMPHVPRGRSLGGEHVQGNPGPQEVPATGSARQHRRMEAATRASDVETRAVAASGVLLRHPAGRWWRRGELKGPHTAESLAPTATYRTAPAAVGQVCGTVYAMLSRCAMLRTRMLLRAARSYRPAFPFAVDPDGAVTPLEAVPLPVLPTGCRGGSAISV